jgi:hypothetical protein
MQKLYLILITLILVSCCKEPPPCNVQYFADVEIQEHGDYTLLIDNVPVDSWKGSSRTVDISERYTGVPADFRVKRFIDLGGPNNDGIFYYSDVYRDSVRVPSVPLVEIKDQSGSGVLSVVREGNRNKILVRNALPCASQAKLTYNGKDTLLNMGTGSTENGSDYRFETEDSVFNITFQLLTPCEFWPRELMKVSSSSIQPFDFSGLSIGVRKEDCETIKK